MQASLRSALLLLLAGLCSLTILGQSFVLPCPRANKAAVAAATAAAPLRPRALSLLPLRAAADGGVGAGVGAVEMCRRKIQEALSPVDLVVRCLVSSRLVASYCVCVIDRLCVSVERPGLWCNCTYARP